VRGLVVEVLGRGWSGFRGWVAGLRADEGV